MGLVDFKKFKVIPLEKLVKADWNYKKDNPELTKKLVANIKRNGQVENLLVRVLPGDMYEVINGNHRLDALIELDSKSAVCYDFGGITKEAAQRIAIETNETKFESDNVDLSGLLKGISEVFDKADLVQTMPYSEDELERLITLVDFDFDSLEPAAPEKEEEPEDNSLKILLTPEQEETWKEWLGKNGALSSKERYGEMLAQACKIALGEP
jgi:ParB-like chromosome segregation protein Spo0J